MAEERIYIFRFENDPCDDCETKEIYPDCNSCPDKEEYSRGLTRQEAIERMAKAICRSGCNECIGDCGSCDLWQTGVEKDYAEAALNALLEVEK